MELQTVKIKGLFLHALVCSPLSFNFGCELGHFRASFHNTGTSKESLPGYLALWTSFNGAQLNRWCLIFFLVSLQTRYMVLAWLQTTEISQTDLGCLMRVFLVRMLGCLPRKTPVSGNSSALGMRDFHLDRLQLVSPFNKLTSYILQSKSQNIWPETAISTTGDSDLFFLLLVSDFPREELIGSARVRRPFLV